MILYENLPAVMNTTRIYPTTPPAGSELKGYCKASDNNRDNLTYYYKWIRNGVELISGVSSSYTQGTEQMVSKLVGASYSVGDQMTFRCLANDGNSNTSWMSTTVTAGNAQAGGGVSDGEGSVDTGSEYVSPDDEKQEEIEANSTELSDQGNANQTYSTAENEDDKPGFNFKSKLPNKYIFRGDGLFFVLIAIIVLFAIDYALMM